MASKQKYVDIDIHVPARSIQTPRLRNETITALRAQVWSKWVSHWAIRYRQPPANPTMIAMEVPSPTGGTMLHFRFHYGESNAT